jgi:hypothetical protein
MKYVVIQGKRINLGNVTLWQPKSYDIDDVRVYQVVFNYANGGTTVIETKVESLYRDFVRYIDEACGLEFQLYPTEGARS